MSTKAKLPRGRKGQVLEVPIVYTPQMNAALAQIEDDLAESRIPKSRAAVLRAEIEEQARTIALAPWTRLFDPKQTSIREFIESFRVQTKRLHHEPGKRASANVPFVERDAQRALREEIERQWAPHDPQTCIRKHPVCRQGHGACVLALKDRTQGISEEVQRLIFERVCRGGGGKAKVVSHKEQATIELYGKIKHMRRQVPDWAFRYANGQMVEIDSKNELHLVRNEVETSGVMVITCGDGAMGRGGDMRWVHISEFPWWTQGKDGLGGFLESWEDAPGNFVVLESTGKEMDEFYDMWMTSQEGRGNYVGMFFSWLTHPDKRSAFFSEAEKAAFLRQKVGFEARYGQVDEQELLLAGATAEQIKWRREKIDSPEIKGDLQVFRREHPFKPEHSFLTKSASIYPKEIVTAWMSAPLHLARKMDTDALVAELTRKTVGSYEWAREQVEPREDKLAGRWRIYRRPEIGGVYAWGSDVAEGFELNSDGKTESDWSTILVREVQHPRKRICAIFRDHLRPDLLALEILKCAILYGHARGYVERNNHGNSVIQEIHNLGATDIMLTERRLVPTETGKRVHNYKFGFWSSGPSKAHATDLVKRWLYDLGMPDRAKPPEPAIPECLAKEYMRYERVAAVKKRTGAKNSTALRMAATQGFDDLVSADYLAMAAVDVLEREVDKQSRVKTQMSENDRIFLQILRSQLGDVEGPGNRRVDPDMGRYF